LRIEGESERGFDMIWAEDRDLRSVVHDLDGIASGSLAGIGGRGISWGFSSTGVGGSEGFSTGAGGGRGRTPFSEGVRGRAMPTPTSKGGRVGEDSLEWSGMGFRSSCLARWASFSDLEKGTFRGKREDRRGRHEHFLLGLVILATAMVDASPSAVAAAAAAASTGGKGIGNGRGRGRGRTEDIEANGAGRPKGEGGRGRRDLLLLFKAMVRALSSSPSVRAMW
jgi:hypothetical protein